MRTFFGAAVGTAYRFTLPDLIKAPSAKGDQVQVDVAYVAATHASLLSTTEPLCQHLAQPRRIFGSVHVVQLLIGDVLWLVPMATPTGRAEVAHHVVDAQRWLVAPPEITVQAADRPTHATAPDQGCDSSAEGWPRYKDEDKGPFDYTSRVPPANGYGPLSSRASDDPNIVANFPLYTDRMDEDEEDEDYNNLLTPYEVPVNVAFDGAINFTRYVDVLPQGDAFPADAMLLDKRLAPNAAWSISQSMQTQFVATKMPAETRPLAWHLLTTPGLGYPGEIYESAFHYSMSGYSCRAWLGDKRHDLGAGRAVLKLLSVGGDYACQPRSATPEASYMLNHWRLVVEQDGEQCEPHQPLGEDMDWEAQTLFKHLAELASAERAPGNIIYSKASYWYSEEVSGVGVRLRDGGSRMPLEVSKDGRLFIKVPGDAHLHSKWGRFDGKHHEFKRRRYVNERVVRGLMAELRLDVPQGLYDIIIKVNDTAEGDFRSLQYALRPRGSFKPIDDSEWLPLSAQHIDEWAYCFLINLAKVTWGCLNRDLVRRAPTPEPSESTSGEATTPTPAEGADSSDGVIKREEKRVRFS